MKTIVNERRITMKKIIIRILSITLCIAVAYSQMLGVINISAEGNSAVYGGTEFDFESDDQLADFDYVVDKLSATPKTTANPKPNDLNSSEKTLLLKCSQGKGARAVYNKTLSDDTRVLSKVKGKLYTESSFWYTELIYWWQDENNYKKFLLCFQNGSWNVRKYVCMDGYTNKSGVNNVFSDVHNNTLPERTATEWMGFEIEYSSVSVTLKLSYDGAESQVMTFNQDNPNVYKDGVKVGEPKVTLNTGKFGFGTTAKVAHYFDDIEITFADTVAVESERFKSQHNYILNCNINNITLEDKSALESALTAFDNLGLDTRLALEKEEATLNAVKIRMDSLQLMEDNGYKQLTWQDTINEDFEDDSFLDKVYCTENTQDPYYSLTIAQDPDDANNQVLKLDGSDTEHILWRHFAWPEMASINKVEFDIKIENIGYDVFRNFYITPCYIDKDNRIDIDFRRGPTSGISNYYYLIHNFTDGIKEETRGTYTLDFNQWVHVRIDYDIKTLKYKMIFTYKNGEDGVYNSVFKLNAAKAQFVFCAPYVADYFLENKYATVYYDNLNISFTEGDWDEDVQIYEPTAWYQGNTWISAGETSYIYGQSLTDTITGVEIAHISDDAAVADKEASYVKQNYPTSVDVEGNYVASTDPTFSGGTPVDILQSTTDSIKFKVTDDTGIYAVRLKAKYNGCDDTYIYLNRPKVNNILGDEGDIATAGGEVRITGSNLAPKFTEDNPTYDAEKIVQTGVIVKLYGANGYKKTLTVSGIQSVYSLSAVLPSDIPNGEYEILVYNGYGDNTCYSAPYTVKVEESPFASRSAEVFNVKDYGAVGDGITVDTAAFVRAFTAASLSGNGGTVYLPAGTYFITNQIIVPENVHLKGQSKESAYILVGAYKFDINELPNGTICIGSNTEISDITFLATRAGHMIKSSSGSQNVKIHDICIQMTPNSGKPTGGTHSGALVELSVLEAHSLLYIEAKQFSEGIVIGSEKNAQINNCEVTTGVATLSNQAEYSKITNNTFASTLSGGYDYVTGGWAKGVLNEYSVAENNFFDHQLLTYEDAKGSYLGHNTVYQILWNNREQVTNDGSAYYGGDRSGVMQYIDDTHYSIYGKIGKNLTGKLVYVVSGQGALQGRYIIGYEFKKNTKGDDITVIEIDQPFVIAPNRNSRVTIYISSMDMILTHNVFRQGNTAGTYSGGINLVYSNNTFDCVNTSLYCNNNLPTWFYSAVDNTFSGFRIITAPGVDKQGWSGVLIFARTKDTMNGLLIRSNVFSEKCSIVINNSSYALATVDVIIERNSFDEPDVAIKLPDTSALDGYYIANNNFGNSKNSITNLSDATNDVGDKKIVVLQDEVIFILGDVNQDGDVNIKDSTYIKYYIAGDIVLSDKQLEAADVNLDGNVDILDSVIIRLSFIGEATIGEKVDVAETDSGWIGPY